MILMAMAIPISRNFQAGECGVHSDRKTKGVIQKLLTRKFMADNLSVPISAALQPSSAAITSFQEGDVTLASFDEKVATGTGYTVGDYRAKAVEKDTGESTSADFSVDSAGVLGDPETTSRGGRFRFINDAGALKLVARDQPASPRNITFKVFKEI